MRVLGLDCGSSSVKAAVLQGGRVVGRIVRQTYPSHFDGTRAEIDPEKILCGLSSAIHQLGAKAKSVDVIAIDTMAPSWVAMDKSGQALTPVVLHQDRRSLEQARRIEKAVGKARHLKLSGNRPTPGGISSTTWAWFNENQKSVMKRADLVGHLGTFLHRRLTGARVIDPSNASFTGLYSTLTLGGWNDELCDAVGIDRALLPEVIEGNAVAGRVTPDAARRFGLTAGTPVLAGVIDSTAAILLKGATVGRMTNLTGTTDVLALCTDKPQPDERLLTRAVGVGRLWVQVATIAAAGAAFDWVHRQLFCEMTEAKFWAAVRRSAKAKPTSPVQFDPHLAGDRIGVEPKSAAFTGLSLATTRDDLLKAVVESMATASAARLPVLKATGTAIDHHVLQSGGLAKNIPGVMTRDWPGRWTFEAVNEATLRGLAELATVVLAA